MSIAIVAGTVPMFAAIEKWIIPVKADIELALNVTPHIIEFGTVFAQENLTKDLEIAMSPNFIAEQDAKDICYDIMIEDHTEPGWEGNLSKFLTLEGDAVDGTCPQENPYSLDKDLTDFSDTWTVRLTLPGVFTYDSTGSVLCADEDFLPDQICNVTLGDLGKYSAKIQIEVSEISRYSTRPV